jgi:hypothetical protein
MTTDSLNRRQFLGRVGAGTLGAGAAYYGGTQYAGSPVQNAQAIAPLIIGAGVAGSVALGWALREYEIVGSDAPAEGLTGDALKQQVYQTAKTRKSTNASTIIDNQNILDGMKHTAYVEAKISAIEQLNAGVPESEVQTAAQDAVDDYLTTVQSNLLKTWNESVREFYNIRSTLESHPDVGPGAVLDSGVGHAVYHFAFFRDKKTRDITLFDGSTFQLESVEGSLNDGETFVGVDPLNLDLYGNDMKDNFDLVVSNPDGGNVVYLDGASWKGIHDDVSSVHQNVLDGISMWVTNVYGDVQSGDLEISDLVTPRERAAMMSDDEDFPQAIADLQALNIAIDLDREAEVYLPDLDATIYGQLAYTGDTQLELGTVDPTATDPETGDPIYPGSFYITYDISRGEGTWGDYNSAIDGGLLTFTAEPYAETVFTVQTAAGETAEVTSSDFTDNGDGTWTADLFDQLENTITNAEQIKFYSETGDTQYETIQLDQTFEIKGFTDSEGNEYNSSNFERSEPQTDANYITQEEWDELEQQNQDLIQKYEESQNDGGGGTIFDRLGGGAIPIEGLIVGGAALLIALFRR